MESIFQGSKVFEHGGPFVDLFSVSPKEAKQDERLRDSGQLISFCLHGEEWALEPKSLFYDLIFVRALIQNYGFDLDLSEYVWFTDIEFSPEKSINCQARSVAIYKLLQQLDCFQVLEEKNKWIEFHLEKVLG